MQVMQNLPGAVVGSPYAPTRGGLEAPMACRPGELRPNSGSEFSCASARHAKPKTFQGFQERS